MYAVPRILLAVTKTQLLENLNICCLSKETFQLGPNFKFFFLVFAFVKSHKFFNIFFLAAHLCLAATCSVARIARSFTLLWHIEIV
jgi:hypothetical protein